jgi:hypothetical protein
VYDTRYTFFMSYEIRRVSNSSTKLSDETEQYFVYFAEFTPDYAKHGIYAYRFRK